MDVDRSDLCDRHAGAGWLRARGDANSNPAATYGNLCAPYGNIRAANSH